MSRKSLRSRPSAVTTKRAFQRSHDFPARPKTACCCVTTSSAPIEEDAQRHCDFTINSLYYSAADFTVRDYVGGMQDLKDGLIRLIGTPETRYREDPVRMLRARRFAAKLNMRVYQPGNRRADPAPGRPDQSTLRRRVCLRSCSSCHRQATGTKPTTCCRCEYNLFQLLFPTITRYFTEKR
ncbi:hypothetical protein MJ560_05195 [Klebsiella pneumoniae]|nr:hypothetical protein MJ560_05195 [Klebsiella pneumoniae]